MSETRNEMQVVDERLLADEWETIATPEPEIVAHLFGLRAQATEKTKATKATEATEATGGTEEAEGAKRSLKSLPSLRSLEEGDNG